MTEKRAKFEMFPPGTEVYVQGAGLGTIVQWENPHEATVEYHSGFVNTVSYRRIDSSDRCGYSKFRYTGG